VAYTINGSNSTFPAFEPTRVGVSARATSGMEVASSGAVLATRSLDTGSYQVDRVYLGVSTALASTFVGTIARVGAWRRRLETIELQVLTTVPPFLLLDPSITGTPTNGQTLTAVAAQPSGTSSTRTYQWNRGGTPIDGATSDTYTLVAADVGQSITVTQTETNSAGAASATSPGVGPVLEA
jgi:hypothetical protein